MLLWGVNKGVRGWIIYVWMNVSYTYIYTYESMNHIICIPTYLVLIQRLLFRGGMDWKDEPMWAEMIDSSQFGWLELLVA